MSPRRPLRGPWSFAAALALLLAPVLVSAASFSLRSEVDARKAGLQDQLQLTLTVEGSGAPDEVPLPPLTNLEVVGGPSLSTQVSIVNGRMSQARSYTYVLQARAVGRAEVGIARAGDQSAPAIPIEVVAGSVRQGEPRQGRSGTDPFGQDPFGDPFEEMMGRRRGRAVEPKLLVEASPSRTRLRVGEPLVLTYVLYTQVSIADLQLKDAPQYAGFWVEDLERPAQQGQAASVGGERFTRFALLRKLLFPTKAGALTLPPASFRIGLARQGFFDAGGTVERATRPVTITVDPLPDAPGFSGAVGRFEVSAALDRQAVPLGEAATLRFRVAGTGNLKWIERGPEVAARGAKVYPPQVKTDLRSTAEGIEGSRTWEFVVVPETTGAVEIPALSFSWFDPAAGRVVSQQTPALSLRVEGGTSSAGVPAAPGPSGARVATGALPLRSQLDPQAVSALALSGRGLAGLALVVLLLHAALLLAGRAGGLSRGTPGGGGSSRSARAALRDLERAGQDALSKEQAAVLLEKALHEAFGEVADEDDGERARAVRALLDEVRFVRYAPQLGDYSDKIRDLAARGKETVRKWA